MAKDTVNMPAGFGGLLRYSEEYDSKLKIKPAQVIIFIILIILFIIILNAFFPIA